MHLDSERYYIFLGDVNDFFFIVMKLMHYTCCSQCLLDRETQCIIYESLCITVA